MPKKLRKFGIKFDFNIANLLFLINRQPLKLLTKHQLLVNNSINRFYLHLNDINQFRMVKKKYEIFKKKKAQHSLDIEDPKKI